jgi:outer membrane protein TolC
MKRLSVILITLLAVRALFVYGEETLSLERTRELALSNSRSLAKYRLAVQGSALDEKTQGYAGFPSLSAGLSASATLWTGGGITQDILKDSFRAGANIGVSQQLWDGGKNSLLKAISSIATGMARQDALTEYFSVLDAADTAYYAVLEAAAALDAAESSLETGVLGLSVAEIRLAGNMISEADYLQAQAEKESREAARNQARRDLSLCRTKLKALTGLTGIPEPEAVDFDDRETFLRTLADLDDAGLDRLCAFVWKQAAERNPGLIKAGLNSARAEKNVSLAARDYSPTISASVSTGLNYTIAGGFNPSPGSLSLSANIPLDFHVTAANVEKRKNALEQAALDYRSAEVSLDLEIQSALLDLVSQAGQALSSRRALDYAGKRLEYVTELYRLSQNSPSELSDAQALVSANRNQLIRARYGFLRGLSAIRSLGLFDSEDEIEALVYRAASDG